ncbi:hypothetical protein DEAC_c40000 [Desulfosporosinus acididurans]|uniref:Uncharacterized protein n=1 Tax=Desulfosporosinus acididurans TaxID=476652 RepID=A0A0J1IH76_9FIRM|nr:hypothetical protein [Desulfosporosinus acididurans]KLU64006.1 hypothetical protein DEAC_c40000 [Desulfosporosinus acididurans]
MNYWLLYTLADGKIYNQPYLGSAEEWTNIPEGCGVLGPFPQDTASPEVLDAYANPYKYIVKDGVLVLQPYFTLTFTGGTITATLNSPPTTPPTSCDFTILGKTFTEVLTNNQATLSVQIHPSIASQQIQITASSDGCVNESLNIGGQGTTSLQIYTDSQRVNHIAPVSKSVLQSFYTSVISPAYALADLTTGAGLMFHVLFSKVLPALTGGTNPLITLSDNEKNTLSDISSAILGKIPVTMEISAPLPASGQTQTYDRHYESFRDHWAEVESAFQNYATDLENIPNLV